MLLLLLLFKARENIKLRCLKIIIKKLYHFLSQLKYHAIQTKTLQDSPQSTAHPTLAAGTHDVSYHLPAEVLVLGACIVRQAV